MTVIYDPTIIEAYAERLYRKANNVVAVYSLLGVWIGLSVGYILAANLGVPGGRGRMPYEGLSILLVGGIAWSFARSRAIALRAHAQLALCQLRIEEQNRSASPARA